MSEKKGIFVKVGEGDGGMTARGVLRREKGVSQRLVRKIAHGEGEGAGALYVNGHPARFRDRVKAGDEIRLVFPDERSWIEPEDIPLSVLYEDGDILVIDKSPGFVVHPTKGHREGTIAGAIVGHMQKRGEHYKPRFISRLDMDTSGVLLVGKNSHAQDNLAKQGIAGGVEKYYTAVLEGRLEDDLPAAGIIDLPVGIAKPGEPRRAVTPEEEGGYASQTAYEVLITASGSREGSEDLFEHSGDGSFYVHASGAGRSGEPGEDGSFYTTVAGTEISSDLLGSLLNKSSDNFGCSPNNITKHNKNRPHYVRGSSPNNITKHNKNRPHYVRGSSPSNITEHNKNRPRYVVIEHNKNRPRYVVTVVRARLITGRTHQIRVHFAYYGHPVLGDLLYGNPTELIGRQALHASEIVFAHPVTGRPMRIEAPLPADMAALLI